MSPEQLFCVNHPNTPTALRCNRCGSPICPRCAVQTPVGYRCKSCVKNQQAVFYTAVWYDYVIAGVVTLVIAGLAQLILFFIPYIIVMLFVGPVVGGLVAEAVRLATGKRRGRYTWLVVAGCLLLVSLPVLLLLVSGSAMITVLVNALYLALAVGTASTRLRLG